MHAAAASRVPQIRFSSQSAPPGEALDQWRDCLSQSWALELAEDRSDEAFSADVSVWNLGGVVFGSGRFGPLQRRARQERNIRADQLDHYRLMMLREGRFDCDADGQQVRLMPGQFVLTDLARPEVIVSAGDSLVLYIPRDKLDEALPQPMQLHGHVPGNACARILSNHLAALMERMPQAMPEELPGLMNATVSLVAASVAPSAQAQELARPAIEAGLLRQACRFIEQRLGDEDLGPAQVCAALRVSRSTLYRLFEPLDGVSQFIRERRLARIHEELCRATDRPVVARVAETFGFRSATHFSRAFREQFGYSASDIARSKPAISASRVRFPGERLDRWLDALH